MKRTITSRQAEIGRLVLQGVHQKEIATRLHIARSTVSVQVTNLRRKLSQQDNSTAGKARFIQALRKALKPSPKSNHHEQTRTPTRVS